MSDPQRRARRLRRALFLLPAAGAAAAVMAACGARSSDAGAVPQPGVAKPLTGADIYQMKCARCHGTSREGRGDAPKLDAVRVASLGEQPLRMTIEYGKGRMRGFGSLTPAQVDELVAYLRT